MVYRKWVRSARIEPGELVVVEAEGDVLGCALYDTVGPVALRVIELGDCSYSSIEDLLLAKIEAAYRLRKRLGFTEPGQAYRLVHSDGDSLPGLIIDVYDSLVVYQSSSVVWDIHYKTLVAVLAEILGSEITVYEKSTQRTRRDIGLEPREGVRKQGQTPLRVVIEEGSAKFIVDARLGQKTGFFLDQRLNRLDAENLVEPGSKVLDVFAYTGGFGIHALLAGASEATFVEVDEKAVKMLKENLRINRVEHRARIVAGNVWDVLPKLPRSSFDVVFVDPPAFIPSEKDKEAGTRAYRRVFKQALELAKKPGLVFLSSCSTFLTRDEFMQLLVAVLNGSNYRVVGDIRGMPPDHPVRLTDPHLAYLKSVYIEAYG
jgi:23S rRNA (cytosine1962-C5)-methyltransferase